MIIELIATFAFATSPCQSVSPGSTEYSELTKKAEKKFANAGNLATIASEADSVLAKLIANKSPVLVNWLQERELDSAKEDQIAKAWRLYYFHKFVVDRYPTDNKAINRSLEGLLKDMDDMAFDQSFKSKLEKILTTVKKDAKRRFLSWPIKQKDKQSITHRIDTVQLRWFKGLASSPYANKPLSYLASSLSYDPSKHQIHVGMKTKSYPTDASLYSVLAHEIAHSFDSCQWGLYIKGDFPFKKVESCMRALEGIHVKVRDDSHMKQAILDDVISKEMSQSLQQNPTCSLPQYPPRGVQKDQWPEAFSDWFAAEMFAFGHERIKELPRPDLCRDFKANPTSSLLSPLDRLLKIYLAQPKLAALWPQDPAPTYCELEIKTAD